MDSRKVLEGLKAHEKGCGYRSHDCDMMDCPYRYGDESCDIEELCHDAYILIKEQQKQIDHYKERCETLVDELKAIFEEGYEDA